MDGWKDADFSLFTQIGQGIASALQTAVGSGQLAETKEIPILAQAKAALAELMTKRSSGGTFNETLLLKLKAATGPAGQAVYDLADAYLRVDWAGRQVAQAQEELNAVTERYDAIINPLSAELDGVTTKALPALLESLGKMWDGLWTELQKLWNNAFAEGSLGTSLVDALITGLTNSWDGVTSFVSGKWNALLQAMPGWAKKLFGIEAMPALPPRTAEWWRDGRGYLRTAAGCRCADRRERESRRIRRQGRRRPGFRHAHPLLTPLDGFATFGFYPGALTGSAYPQFLEKATSRCSR